MKADKIFGPSVLVFLLMVLASATPAASQDRQAIDHYLDLIDSEEFVSGVIGPAGGDQPAVEFQALSTNEIKYLVAHSEQSIPLMVERLQSANRIHFAPSRMLYFIVFRKTRDARALPALADYFDSLPGTNEHQTVPGSPRAYDVYPYALAAAQTYGGLSTLPKSSSSSQVFRAKHQIAEQLRAEFKRRQSQ